MRTLKESLTIIFRHFLLSALIACPLQLNSSFFLQQKVKVIPTNDGIPQEFDNFMNPDQMVSGINWQNCVLSY